MKFCRYFFAKISSFIIIFLLYSGNTSAHLYGEEFCDLPGFFHCIKVKGVVKDGVALKSETWESLWPDSRERDIVKKVNRLHIWLFPGTTLAVPDDMNGKTYMDFSPFLAKIGATGEKFYIFSPALLAWAAYDANGNLENWGPALGGKDYCPDLERACRTPAGTYEALIKKGFGYRSNLYPLNCKGPECSWMPYYVRVRDDGLGVHGSKWFIGRHASRGCVRLFTADAKWLNQKFIDIKTKYKKGTKVIFLPYPRK